MIEHVDGRALTAEDRRLLRQADPMLGHPVVIDPMPGARGADLLAEIYHELAVPSKMGRDLERAGRHVLPLRAWHVPAVVILDADFVAPKALDELDALPERGETAIIATFDRPADGMGDLSADLRRIAAAVTDTSASAEPLPFGEHGLDRMAALSHQARRMLADDCSIRELAFVAAAAAIFHRPRSQRATPLWLLGFDDALRRYGHHLTDTDRTTVAHASGAVWPADWLLAAIRPPAPQPREHPIDAPLTTALPASDETARTFSAGLGPNSRVTYQQALLALLAWRREQSIAPTDPHDMGHLVRWGHEMVRHGMALATVKIRVSVARSYYWYLTTGERPDATRTIRPNPRPRLDPHPAIAAHDFVDPYERLCGPDPSAPGPQARTVWSLNGRRVAERNGWTDAQFWNAVDECGAKITLGLTGQGITPTLRAVRERDRVRTRLRGALFILKHDIAPFTLPSELQAGSPAAVCGWIRKARASGLWDSLVDELRDRPELTDVDWHRKI